MRIDARHFDGADGPVVFGPYVGEFGHEVRAWLSYLNAWIRQLEPSRITVLHRPSSGGLYDHLGVAKSCCEDTFEASEFLSTNSDDVFNRTLDAAGEGTVVYPPRGSAGMSIRKDRTHLGEPKSPRVHNPIVGIFARNRAHRPQHNYQLWNEVVEDLATRMPTASFWAIGVSDMNRPIRNTEDHRVSRGDGAARRVMRCISMCDLIVGESSGGMHLACAMSRPSMVFGEARVERRYYSDQHPSVPVRFIGDTRPQPHNVAREAHRVLAAAQGDEKWMRYLAQWRR